MRTRHLALLVFAALSVVLVPLSAAAQEASTTTAPDAPAEASEAIKGRLRHEGDPVSGVTIVVERAGETVGEDTTADDGTWQVPVPGAGDYTVTIDTDTVPEGVELRDPERESFEVSIRPGQERNVLFPLGERVDVDRPSGFERFMTLLGIGVKVGLLVAMASIGLSLVYGVSNLVNFAHGELVTFGALVAYLFNASASGPELHLVPAAIISVVAGGVVGLLMERGMFAPLRRRRTEGITLIVFTIGLSILARHVYLIILGGNSQPYTDYTVQRAYEIGPVALPPKDWVISLIGIVVLVAVGLLIAKTRVGTGMRAVADNRDLAEASGIDVDGIIRFTWMLAGALAALGGALLGVTDQVQWDMGFALLLFMFAAVIVGGLGTAYGAMVGGLLVGIVSQVSTYWLPIEFKDAMALGVLIVALIIRPQGILGLRERVG